MVGIGVDVTIMAGPGMWFTIRPAVFLKPPEKNGLVDAALIELGSWNSSALDPPIERSFNILTFFINIAKTQG